MEIMIIFLKDFFLPGTISSVSGIRPVPHKENIMAPYGKNKFENCPLNGTKILCNFIFPYPSIKIATKDATRKTKAQKSNLLIILTPKKISVLAKKKYNKRCLKKMACKL